MAARRINPPAECPVCGADVPPHARACPACGADERTGWDEEASAYDGLDLPDSAFGEQAKTRPRIRREDLTRTGIPYGTWIIAVVMIAVVASLMIYGIL